MEGLTQCGGEAVGCEAGIYQAGRDLMKDSITTRDSGEEHPSARCLAKDWSSLKRKKKKSSTECAAQ